MTSRLAHVTFDCQDPRVVARFWSSAVDRPIDDGGSEFFQSIGAADAAGAPAWFFIAVPEHKTVKNRLHLDLEATDPDAEAERLVALGASITTDKNEWGHTWRVMADPEGNEFCLSGPHTTGA